MAINPEQFGAGLADNVRQHRTGLVIGGLIGLFSGGLFGLIFGAGIGFMLDRWLKGSLRRFNPREAFFRATFAVMGKIAKADGRVTENEIRYARDVMARMNLDQTRREEAISLFNEGKHENFDIGEVLRPLSALIRYNVPLKLMFVEIQLQAAMSDGSISPAELALVRQVCQQLMMTEREVAALIARMQAQQAYGEHSFGGHQQGFAEPQLLKDAYGVLGVSESASDSEVKKAYRRLMSQHHPDKLVAKGLPAEMMQLAKEKTQEIQAAYDRVKNARKAA
ncbi:co-chaperone DjlA [Marinobacterium sedimentorum]|uniref:co-chaperone DjlA n=1 Tax=Marinobacterium sedimentorum TaxID=2927804 RepID=UPI0020C6D7CE|nr:co-chaperone DjlA [Marinobacterium sedimentorum]MCP8689128.1 co-chaperone DjlA [Marinobacterium sedimentorum]